MNQTNLMWVAGLLEGEGSFSIKERALSVTCGMTDEDVIIKLYELVGGHLQAPKVKENRKIVYTWSLTKREEVINLIKLLQPFMSIRRNIKIQEMLDWNSLYPKGRVRKDTAKHGSLGMYTNHNCRCELCIQALSIYRARRKNVS